MLTYRELEIELREIQLLNYRRYVRNNRCYRRRVGESYLAYLERKVDYHKQQLALLNSIIF